MKVTAFKWKMLRFMSEFLAKKLNFIIFHRNNLRVYISLY